MKKLLLLCTVIFFISCIKTPQTPKADFQESELLSSLQEFNESLEHSDTKATPRQVINIIFNDVCGAWVGWKEGSKIGTYAGSIFGNPAAGAVIGGGIGGICYGAFCSWLAWPENEISEIEPSDIISYYLAYEQNVNARSQTIGTIDGAIDSLLIHQITLPDSLLVIGAAHNYVLYEMQTQGELNEFETEFTPAISSFPEIESEILQSNAFIEMFSGPANILLNTDDESAQIGQKIFNLLLQAMSSCPRNTSDAITIINHYYHTIQTSNRLTEEEKKPLYAGLATAIYSFDYWTSYIGNDEE